ncbi:MAG: Gfo/Idh/MocA family oxidoreductase [Deltaproteobacteria bacterium]|nr:Gfo/Idh/MocA family oxidoreductase [Deltaproteobacteria bacterium]
MPEPISIALLGAGARGELNLATLARRHADALRFVAVAEPHEGRRKRFAEAFRIPAENVFTDWREFADRPQLADATLNALPCRMHFESALASLMAGYHVFLEKPMALDPGECVKLTDTASALDRLLMIALQCRYNRMYTRVRQQVDGGAIGRLMSIDCAENIGYWHFVLSYVRGIHHHSSLSHSFVLAKGIHDLDLVAWFAGAPAARVASFGNLAFFREENAPPGAPERCTDGCPVEAGCEFSALKQYVRPGRPAIPMRLLTGMSAGAVWDVLTNPRFRTLASVVSPDDLSESARLAALAETDYGRCVFRAPNDVVDHQTVSIEFENGVTASLHLNAFSVAWERTLNLHGTAGELRSADFSGKLQTRTFNPARVRDERIRYHGVIHGGGDEVILVEFARAVRSRDFDSTLVSARNTLASHLICFAAEEARLQGRVVEMEAFRKRAVSAAAAL